MIRHSIAFFLLCLVPSVVNAECNPAADACAPKKSVDAWNKSASAGFNLSRGNTETMLLNIGLAANQEDSAGNIWDFAGAMNYGEDNAREDSGLDKVSKNDVRATGRYDRLLSERSYVGTGVGFLYDEIADVDYRVNFDVSPGYYVLKNADHKLRFDAGPGYVFEKVGGEENDYFAPRVGNRWDWIISCTSKIFERTDVIFDVSDSQNYLVNAEVGIESAISSSLALVVSVRDQYDHVPAASREKNDLQFTTALKVSL